MFIQILAIVCITPVVHCIDHCWLCDNAPDLTTCRNTTTTCNVGEQCFLEKFVNTLAETRYNAGCRSQYFCRAMEALSHRKRRLDPCSQCCTGPRCQEQLCGSTLSTESRYRCLHCASVSSTSSCTERVTCQDTEVCKNDIFVDGGLLRYSFGCEDTYKCKAFLALGVGSHTGRRDDMAVGLCSSCCVGDECNKGDCFQMRHDMRPGMFGP
ncbi:uncharacterized protein LOC117341529 isoform X2 [Pecten maximus]|uniref:uncharacterized protein LOC117341529 isoform X2 n=1 Tax=Pecten maximus TaxID=6579 RepID=UPI00145901DE|nr:uncharacterized protein LOC117341529 isoform X2 [Pecten maximus]